MMFTDPNTVTKESKWQSEASNLLCCDNLTDDYYEKFHTEWTVSGHRIREQIGNDLFLIKLLRHVLPSYEGASQHLYRGENIERWNAKSIGLCWSSAEETAAMFGRGLNSTPTGGVLLKCNCKPEWIIAGPSKHSRYLGEEEYTIDTGLIKNVVVLKQYKEIWS